MDLAGTGGQGFTQTTGEYPDSGLPGELYLLY